MRHIATVHAVIILEGLSQVLETEAGRAPVMPIVRLEGSLAGSAAVGHIHDGRKLDCLYWREEAWALPIPVKLQAMQKLQKERLEGTQADTSRLLTLEGGSVDAPMPASAKDEKKRRA